MHKMQPGGWLIQKVGITDLLIYRLCTLSFTAGSTRYHTFLNFVQGERDEKSYHSY